MPLFFPVSAKLAALPSRPPVLVFGLWMALTAVGLAALLVYSSTPGRQAAPPSQWPPSSGLQRAPDKSTLVMFLHPKCPCSQASLSELSAILAHSAGRLRVDLVFLQPSGRPESWTRTTLWRSAATLPETSSTNDAAGREARLFHTFVSGEALLYDSSGNLRFHGGITNSRGHAGDNPGSSSVEAYLNTGTVPVSRTPVFGCPLFDDSMPVAP